MTPTTVRPEPALDRPSPADPVPGRHEGDEVSLLEFVTPLVRRWHVLLAIPLLTGLLAAGVSLILPPSYEGESRFTPENSTPTMAGGLMSLASQYGFSLGTQTTNSPEFFAEVLESREVLDSTLLTPVTPGGRTLLDHWKVRGASFAERLELGREQLKERMEVSVDNGAGIVALTVTDERPEVAARVTNRLVELLGQFNVERRQSQSRAQRRFVEQRLEQARRELQEAEERQLAFLQQNRTYAESPLLMYQANRLARDVQVKQEVFLNLSTSYEEARIAEVKDTPILTVIDTAVAPVRRAWPRRAEITLFGVFLGLVLAVVVAYVGEYTRAARRTGSASYEAFRSAWLTARAEIGRAVTPRQLRR